MQVPWANLGAAPVIVEMDRIFVLATPNTEFQSQSAEPEVSRANTGRRWAGDNAAPGVSARCFFWPALGAAEDGAAGGPSGCRCVWCFPSGIW